VDLPHYVEAYLTRPDWGAQPLVPTAGYPLAFTAPVGAVLHHTVMPMLPGETPDAYMRRLQRARPDLGNEVPYTFVLFPGASDASCVVAEGRGMGRTGAHTAGLNSTRIAIAVAGNTDADCPLTAGMVAGFRWVCATFLANPFHAVPTIGHQQAPPYFSGGANLNATACPGNDGMANLPKLQPPFILEEDDDMPLTADDHMAIALRVRDVLASPEFNPGTVPSPNVTAALSEIQANTRALLAGTSTLDAADVTAIVQGLRDNLGDEIARSIGEKLVGG
jgi:hypothetical protein